jgi:hypothetical protein
MSRSIITWQSKHMLSVALNLRRDGNTHIAYVNTIRRELVKKPQGLYNCIVSKIGSILLVELVCRV